MPVPRIVQQWKSWSPYFLSMLRIIAAFMFILAGTTKLFAFPAASSPDGGTVEWLTQIGIGAALEVFGGAMLLLGWLTRPVAFILAGEMAVAYFQFHAPASFWPSINRGVPAALYCFVFLYISSAGPGPWSIDAKVRSTKS